MEYSFKEVILIGLDDPCYEEGGRYMSWEYCYKYFQENVFPHSNNYDDEHAALMLGFYLASWGMYRGSSQLLQKFSYPIHKGAIKILIKYKDSIDTCYNELSNYYKNAGVSPTDTLITKIMLGTIGNVPAYDRYFKLGVKIANEAFGLEMSQTFSEKNVNDIIKTFKENIYQAKNLPKSLKNHPFAKIIDLYFWNLGLISENKSNK